MWVWDRFSHLIRCTKVCKNVFVSKQTSPIGASIHKYALKLGVCVLFVLPVHCCQVTKISQTSPRFSAHLVSQHSFQMNEFLHLWSAHYMQAHKLGRGQLQFEVRSTHWPIDSTAVTARNQLGHRAGVILF